MMGDSQEARPDVDYLAPCSWYFRWFILGTSECSRGLTVKKFLMSMSRFLAFTSFPIIGTVIHFMRFYSESPVCVMEDILMTSYQVSTYAYVIMFMRDPTVFTITISRLYEFFPKPKDLDEMRKLQQKCADFGFGSIIIAVTGGMILYNLDSSECGDMMHTPMGYRTCGFMVPMWLPIEFDRDPIRVSLIVLQCVHESILILLFLIFGEAYGIIIHHLIRGYDYLILLLEDVDNVSKQTLKRNRLVTFVKLHAKFLELLDELIQLYQPYFLVFTISAVVFIACPIIDIIWVGPVLAWVSLLVGWLFGLTFVMATSQVLSNKSIELHQAVTNLRWYDMDKESRHMILFILMRTQKPTIMKTPFTDVSHPALLSAWKAIYSLTTAMLQDSRA